MGDETMRILVVQNDPDKDAGRIGAALRAHGANLETAMATAPLPALDGYDGLVVLPGLANPVDTDPPVERARAAIREALERGLPVLGICLGGQLVAEALGGAPYRCAPELGYGAVRATAAAADDPLLGGIAPTTTIFHAHAYAFEAPPEATILLENDTSIQALRVGDAWALQCHPEAPIAWVEAIAERMRGHESNVLPETAGFFVAHDVDPDALVETARAIDAEATRLADGIAAGFLERCRRRSRHADG